MFDISNNHYVWLEKHLPTFLKALNMPYPDQVRGLLSAHGDKGSCYKTKWNKAGIPYVHGMALFLLTYEIRYTTEVRETANGWIAPDDWVINNYERFKPHLPTDDLEGWLNRSV